VAVLVAARLELEKSRRSSISMAFLYCFSGRTIGGSEEEEGWREEVEVETELDAELENFLIRGVRGMMGPVRGVRARWFVRRGWREVVVVEEEEMEEEVRETWLVKLSPDAGVGLFLLGEAGESMSFADSSYPAGVKTSHINPTNRPLEHSCRNAISSQNCSRLLTLRQCPEPRFDGDSVTWLAGTASRNSSSNSSRKRAFGSSGKCGTRHLGGSAEPKLEISRKGWPCFQRVRRLGSDRT